MLRSYLRPILMFILFALLFSPLRAHAQSNCPGDTYLGWGQGQSTTSPYPHTDLNVSFPNGYGSAYLSGPFEIDADAQYQTCNSNTWNCIGYQGSAHFGTVTYNDGTINYSGACRFWIDLAPATPPICTDYNVPHTWMVRRLKIQSCSPYGNHALSTRFIAVSCDGSYCESITGTPCDSSSPYDYASENWLTLSVSGF